MRATLKLPPSIALIEAALQGLVAANRVLIQTGIVPPSPLDARVRYKREASGLEEWNTAIECMKLGWGDCEDLNCWECAGVQLEDDPDAIPHIVQTGKRRFHCVVLLSSGELHDVCPDLGMGHRDRGASLSGLPHLEAQRANEILGAVSREHRANQMTARDKVLDAVRKRRAEAWRRKTGRTLSESSPQAKGRRVEPPTGPRERAQKPSDPMDPSTMTPGTSPTTEADEDNDVMSPPMTMPLMEDFDGGELPDEDLDDGGSAA